jgi:hypothetical protein
VLLRRWWKPLFAIIITVMLFDFSLQAPSWIIGRFSPESPEFLYLPHAGQDLLELRMDELSMVGRSQELETLNGFLMAKG